MNTVIFYTENAVFKFALKEVKERLICKHSGYALGEVTQLLELISTDTSETILNSDVRPYFGFVAMDLIGAGIGAMTCKICGKTYEAGQLKEITVGHGKSPFNINKERKGGIRLFEKGKMPSLFGGKGFICPEGHKLISMETWRT